MSTSRLQQQFIRLWQHYRYHGKTTETTLQQLADVLKCSRRHMRSLLNTMQQRDWLTWQAGTGAQQAFSPHLPLHRPVVAAAVG